MRISSRSKLSIAFTFFALATVIVGLVATAALRGSAVKAASSSHMHIDCAAGATTCTEVYDSAMSHRRCSTPAKPAQATR